MSYQLPPVFTKLQKHAVFPEFSHDERARYNFLSNLNRFVSTVIAPGNKIAFENRVEPNFVKENGKGFTNRHEVAKAMSSDPIYQCWGALRRSTMEMRQQNGRAVVLRQATELAKKVANFSKDNLHLKDNFIVPAYLKHVDATPECGKRAPLRVLPGAEGAHR